MLSDARAHPFCSCCILLRIHQLCAHAFAVGRRSDAMASAPTEKKRRRITPEECAALLLLTPGIPPDLVLTIAYDLPVELIVALCSSSRALRVRCDDDFWRRIITGDLRRLYSLIRGSLGEGARKAQEEIESLYGVHGSPSDLWKTVPAAQLRELYGRITRLVFVRANHDRLRLQPVVGGLIGLRT